MFLLYLLFFVAKIQFLGNFNKMALRKEEIKALLEQNFIFFIHMIFKEYNVRVASRYFKGPELLVDYQMYDYRFLLSIYLVENSEGSSYL